MSGEAATRGPAVDVVVLTYDGKALLADVLPSVYGQTYGDLAVLLVDNGSTDGSVQYVEENWPATQIVSLPTNVGVAAALNRGIDAGDAQFVALLNNDIELDPNWLRELVRALQEHPQAAAATGKMLNFWRRDVIDGAGDIMIWAGVPTRRGHGEVDRGQYDTPGVVFSPSGAASVFRREAFDLVGRFDEDFHAYLEDVDWGFRAQLAGFTCLYVPSAIAYHVGSATTKKNAGFYTYLMRRNLLTLVAKNYPASRLLRHAHRLLVYTLVQAVVSFNQGLFRAYLRGWREALAALPVTLKKRSAIQRARKVDSRYLESVIEANWGFEVSGEAGRRFALGFWSRASTLARRREPT